MEPRKSSRLPAWSRVWITARHSPGKTQSIEAQLATLRDYCEANKLIIDQEFIDKGVSGSDTSRRDAFCRMLDLVETHKQKLVDGVICYDSSRLAREFDDATWARALLRRRGYVLEIIIGDDYPDDLYGYMMRGAQDYFNAEQIALISQKSKDGLRSFMRLKDSDGSYFGFWPMGIPWGFRQVFKKLPVINTVTGERRVRQCIEPDYDLWPLGRELFHLRNQGLSYRQIEARTGWLSSRGTVDVSKTDIIGRMYHAFFSNPIYFGQLRMKELVIDGYVPAMVNYEIWTWANETAERFRRGNWRGAKAGKTKDAEAILAGLCCCGLCGSLAYHTITATSRNRLRYYLCSLKRRLSSDSCPNGLVRADSLERRVLDHISDVYFDPAFVFDLVNEVNAILSDAQVRHPETERLHKELVEVSWSINNLIRLGEKARGEINELSERLLLLQAQKNDIEVRLEHLDALPKLLPIRVGRKEIVAELDEWKRFLEAEPKQAVWKILSKVVLEPGRATIYYRKPLCFYDNYPSAVVGFSNGYIVELPVKKHADSSV